MAKRGPKQILWWKLFFILGFLLYPGITVAAVFSPSIQLSVDDYHFGELTEGTVFSYDFVVRNTGAVVLEIADVRPD